MSEFSQNHGVILAPPMLLLRPRAQGDRLIRQSLETALQIIYIYIIHIYQIYLYIYKYYILNNAYGFGVLILGYLVISDLRLY